MTTSELVDGTVASLEEQFSEISIDYTDLENKYRVSMEEGFDGVLIIDNLPKIDASKEEKLLAVLKKNVFGPAAALPKAEGGTFMPRDPETGMSRGYLFVEFESVEAANAVAKIAQGYKLDKSHVLSAIKFTEIDRIRALPEEFTEPEVVPFVEKEFLKSWMLDPLARDQFVCCSGSQTSVFYNNRDTVPESVYSRASWTDGAIKWSPLGTYLATFHGQGLALWGGASWTKLSRFPHPLIKGAHFSPKECYLVTQSAFNPATPSEPNVLVWEVATGKILRGFVIEELVEGSMNDEDGKSLEAFDFEGCCVLQWSFDELYASRVLPDHIAVYELPAFTPLERRESLNVAGVREAAWSPVSHQLVYWVPGDENTPSRVALWNLSSRQVLRTKTLFSVAGISLHWHSEGDYLGVKIDRFTGKTKKTLTSTLELFRLRVKDIPVEVVELSALNTGVVCDYFAWEPQGTRFLTNQSVEFRSIVNIYDVAHKKSSASKEESVVLVKSLERKQLTRWQWSPRGDFFILAGLDSTSAFLEFWSAPTNAGASDITCLATKEHFLATELSWDPSGRFVVSWVNYWKHQMENGFVIWDFKGDLIAKQNQPRFTAFLWRPRPASLLPAADRREIRRNLKSLAAKFEVEDAKSAQQTHTDATENRKRAMEEWVMYRLKCQTAWEARAKQREAVLHKSATTAAASTQGEIVQEWVEDEVIETIEEIIEEDKSDETGDN